ncbi:tetratricopeptide repeat protein [Streptomyces sp. NPDC001581]|uniref:tetratricopeptide repeat protein n=1 Tax=Streptomyces sp. NPDC001581 TaxID=3154386 RepID=UPI003323289F
MSALVKEIRQELAQVVTVPAGRARSSRAEALVDRARATADAPLLLNAMATLMSAYDRGDERGRMFEVFDQALRLWDEDPSLFGVRASDRLVGEFEWISGLDHPEVPLASIERWTGGMERRRALAGLPRRTVRAQEFLLATHLGDHVRAEELLRQWPAVDPGRPDTALGAWHVRQGRDAEALRIWEAVLAGGDDRAGEPARVLAHSLLPLVRLGRSDEARAHHLRGYRLVRGKGQVLEEIGHHIEFCALTGNETRGLDILGRHAVHLDGGSNPAKRLSLLESAVLLLRRLAALGLGAEPVAGPPGPAWTVDALLLHCDRERGTLSARFDRRNGNTAVSDRSRARSEQQPLLERLPLGIRGGLPALARATVPGGEWQPGPIRDFDQLLAEARRLRDSGHPDSRAAWSVLDQEAAGRSVDGCLRAELAAQRGLRLAEEIVQVGIWPSDEDLAAAMDAFEEAAEAFRASGAPAEAAVNRAHAALTLAYGHERGEEALALADEAERAVRALAEAGSATPRQVTAVLLARGRTADVVRSVDDVHSLGEVERFFTYAAAYAEAAARTDEESPELRSLAAQAQRAAADCVFANSGRRVVLLRACSDNHLLAGRPWDAVEPFLELARELAGLRERPAAEAAAAAAYEAMGHGGGPVDPESVGNVYLLLARLALESAAYEDTTRHALRAGLWYEACAPEQASRQTALAYLALAEAYCGTGRYEEAAEVVRALLPDARNWHGGDHLLRAREVLGRSLRGLGEHPTAAQQLVEGAERLGQAYACGPYYAAGLRETAEAPETGPEAAYQEAWENGSAVDRAGLLRSRARQSEAAGGRPGHAASMLAKAQSLLEEALAEAEGRGEQGEELRGELANTWQPLGEFLAAEAERLAGMDVTRFEVMDGTCEIDWMEDTPYEPRKTAAVREAREKVLAFHLRVADRFASFGPGWEEYRAGALSAATEAELKLRGPQPPTR